MKAINSTVAYEMPFVTNFAYYFRNKSLKFTYQQNKMELEIRPSLSSMNNILPHQHTQAQQELQNHDTLRPTQTQPEHEEKHNEAGQLLKSIIYGGLDGSTAIIIIILSGISSSTSASKILSISISALVGDAIGMGLGDYLSAKAQIEFIANEKSRELYEVENMLDDEKKEVIDLYSKIDPKTNEPRYSIDDANRIADLYATNKEAFVKIMLLQELQLVQIDPIMAKKCGVATFLAFLLFGLIPALPYIVSYGIMKKQDAQWTPVIILGFFELLSLGMAKALLIGLNPWKSGLQTLFFGAAISAIGYGIGFAFPA